MTRTRILLAGSLVLVFSSAASATSIWTEGEAATAKSVQAHPWWYDKVKKDVLSGEGWLSNYGPKEGTAEYAVAVPEDGSYTFWIRANPLQAKLDYAIDGAPPVTVDFKDARGQQNIAEDNKPDMRFIAWVKAGKVELRKGTATVKFRMYGPANNHGGLDCFVFTTDDFVPQGSAKPGAPVAGGPADWFPLAPDVDSFSPDSVIDMSALNDAPAGKYGPVIAEGSTLRFRDAGRPVKFWGAGADFDPKDPKEDSLRRIRYLRKYGINYVRQHPLFETVSNDGILDPAKLAAYDWWFAELKKAGIYSCWSVFYHFPVNASDGYPSGLLNELPELKKGGARDTYGLIQVSPQLWDLRLKAMIALLDHKNPHTGLRYADDPALATVEFQNEDCIFFWNPLGELSNPNTKKWPLHAKMFRQRFAGWVKERYKDDAGVAAAWGGLNGESLANGELQLMGPYELDAGGIRGKFAGRTRRAGDQIRFMTEMQTGLYRRTEEAVRATGFKAQTVTTNWLGGSSLLDQANIFTDTVSSMIDRHNYAGGGAGGHGITEGAVYADSHLGKPGEYLFSIGFKQVHDKPFSLSEWTMCPPNQWKAEAAPIVAFYGMGLHGWDASLHFAQNGSRIGDGWPAMRSYATDTPHYIGQFPALAFAVRKGHFKESPAVTVRSVAPEQLFTGTPAWPQNYYDGRTQVATPGAPPDELFAFGRVTIDFNGGKQTGAPAWDKPRNVITSATGELVWDSGRETILVQSPKTQGVIGRAAGRDIDLPGATVKLATDFVSLIFTPLDDLPLAESRHVLITALARDKQTGASYSGDGTRLEAVGTAPLLLEPVQAVIRLKGAKPVQVRPLDYQGVPKKNALIPAADGSFTIDGTSAAYYYEVKR